MLKNLIRALRLPFISASILPFIFGSFLALPGFNLVNFILGLVAAAAMHLSANLVNDYADSLSGNDWQDKKFWGFFGGSKLIQENVFTEKFYLLLALFFALVSAAAVVALSFILKNVSIIGFYLLILFLGWSYSLAPLRLVYRGWGEAVIFILFGPALVIGGYFIQAGIVINPQVIILSLPFGFFTTAILFSNEIPDLAQDKESGKMTWAVLLGPEAAFLAYYILMFLGFGSIFWAIYSGYLGRIAALSFFSVFLAVKAARILSRDYMDKKKLVASSKITIAIQMLVSVALILDLLL